MMISPGNIVVRLLAFDRFIEICNVFEIIWFLLDQPQEGFISLFPIVRSLRVSKIRRQIYLAKSYFRKFIMKKEEDLVFQDKSYDNNDQLKQFIVSSLIDLVNGIFIEATIILSVNSFRNFEGYSPFTSKGELEYISAAYFIIVSFSTIGYGDIYPKDWFARLIQVILLVNNITVMSSFLGKFTELL